MRDLERMGFDSRESFRSWLEKNHDQSSGIWMVFYKKKLKIDVYVKNGRVDWVVESPTGDAMDKGLVVPDFILKELADNEPALTNFNRLAPTYKRHYVLWITSAKRDETIKKRLNESIGLLKDNRRLELK